MKRFTVHAGGILLLFFLVGIRVISRYLNTSKVAELKQNQHLRSEQFRSPKTILHINPAFTIRSRLKREYALFRGFTTCEERNCYISFDKGDVQTSDAVIFHGREAGKTVKFFNRPRDQVWIFMEDEAPVHMYLGNSSWDREPWRGSFNWSMTYDAHNTDIPFLFGEIKKKTTWLPRNYTDITLQKTGDVLMISSNCKSKSKREKFVSMLRKYIPVKILGACGETWSCGRKYVPDDCYKILNKYRFFLSFENSLCRQYFTEKVFESFRYDTILITRGGNKGEANSLFPNSTFISTDDFDTIEILGSYLQKLSHSTEEYAYMLRRKDEYYSVCFREMYERAMCDVCKRLHNKEKYRKTIPDTRQWLMDSLPCRNPDDIK